MGRNKSPLKKDDWEKFEKNNIIALDYCMLKNEKIYPAYFQNITQIVKNKLFFERFQMEKDVKLSPKDAKLSPKNDDYGIIMQ